LLLAGGSAPVILTFGTAPNTLQLAMRQAAEGQPVRSYSIRELTRISGLSADVLRAWERRYGFPTPSRDGAGVRHYTQQDVERLLSIQKALRLGQRIGNVIALDVAQLTHLLETASPSSSLDVPQSAAVVRVMNALLADDDETLLAELRYAALNLGARAFIRDVVSKLTEEVGAAWERGELQVRHEHLLSDALTTQLRVLRAAQPGLPGAERTLLAAFPGEFHGLGLEMVGAYIAALGMLPLSMGVNTPPADVAESAHAYEVAGIAISASSAGDAAQVEGQLRELKGAVGELPIAIGGALTSRLAPPKGVAVLRSWDELERWIHERSGRAT
jgi:DNA-binding transcriptional MerR regulator/methylmalonyl-CoA mutase cobalamin-binding subunit